MFRGVDRRKNTFKTMKKLFLLFVASVLAVMGAKAEESSTLVATLSHEGKMLAYYGKGALVEAYNAAREGDVITLSAGTFSSCRMSKNITIRGAGMFSDVKSDNMYTSIEGSGSDSSWSIYLQGNDYEFVLEGIWCSATHLYIHGTNQKEVTLQKCGMGGNVNIESGVYPKVIQCYGVNSSYGFSLYQGFCQNCVFRKLYNNSGGASPLILQNCVIYPTFTIQSSSTLTNCLVIAPGTTAFASGTSLHNCVGFSTGVDGDFFTNATNSTNKMVEDRDNFFKNSIVTKNTDQYGDLSGYTVNFDSYNDGNGYFRLSDEAAKIYKGNDGTVVGVWGGAYPFNITPSNPRLTKCEIVPRVGDDGKLNVTIEVAQ